MKRPFASRRLIGLFVLLAGIAAAETEPRGGRVGWARLITSHSGWGIHSDQDPKLAKFIRAQTTLNIDPVWNTVRANRVEELCRFPFIYAKDLTQVRDPLQLRNLQEYLRRGGFLCIDPCTTSFTAAATESFLRRHEQLFQQLVPGCVVRALPDDHELYRGYFTVTSDDLFTRDMIRRGASKPPQIGMLGVYHEGRAIAVISVSGLECGWPQTPMRAPGCMKMIVNIYVHAMTAVAMPAAETTSAAK